MNKKTESANGRENNNGKGYERKEEGGTAKPFGRSKYAGSNKEDKPYAKDGADKVTPAFRKENDSNKPDADADNPWKRPSKSGDRKKAPKADSARPADDADNPWKRASKGGDKKKAPRAESDRPADDADNPWKRPSRGGDRRKPSEKTDDDAPREERKPRTDADSNWKRTEKPERRKSFDTKAGDEGYTGTEAVNKWERPTDDGKKPFPKKDRNEKRPFPKKEGDAPFARKPFPKKEGDAPYESRKPYAKKDGSAPYARKPRVEGEAPDAWKKNDADGKKPFAKKDNDKEKDGLSLWQKGIDYSDRGMPKGLGEKKKIKESDKPFFQRESAKGEDASAEMPDDESYGLFEINDELLEEKKKNRKPAVKKADPARAFKKETNEPISARHGDKPAKKDNGDKKPKNKIEKADEKRPFKKAEGEGKKPFDRKDKHPEREEMDEEPVRTKRRRHNHDEDDEEDEAVTPGAMPLNKYLAHSGVCSRRDAVEHIKEGKIKVNGEVMTNPGYKVADEDEVLYNDKKLTIQKGMVYILLNKPKDYITTNEDPQGRKTVMQLVATAEGERLFPVGRLDRNTSGLLLITNDGDLTQKLAHPSHKIKKIYQVTLDKAVTKADFEKIVNGLELEDGIAHVDALAYLETKSELGIEIHIGRNRIVRRIFESLGYVVEKLDRVMYANLTKKNLPRGKWRYLNEREIVLLKHFKS